ncbi:MAG: diacylglycerol kinase family protein [Bacilli bacterium]
MSKRPAFTFFQSVACATSGIKCAIKQERNLRTHFIISFFVILFATIIGISRTEWCILILLMAFVITTELLNSSVEYVVDLVTEEYHPLAKLAKDVAAGAVLIAAATSVVIGLVLFYPYIVALFV